MYRLLSFPTPEIHIPISLKENGTLVTPEVKTFHILLYCLAETTQTNINSHELYRTKVSDTPLYTRGFGDPYGTTGRDRL